MELALKLLGILFGVLARTFLPYIRKLKQGKVKEFKNGYCMWALTSFVLGTITTLLIFPQFNLDRPGVGVEAWVRLFCLAFGFGFGCNSIVSEVAKWGEKEEPRDENYDDKISYCFVPNKMMFSGLISVPEMVITNLLTRPNIL